MNFTTTENERSTTMNDADRILIEKLNKENAALTALFPALMHEIRRAEKDVKDAQESVIEANKKAFDAETNRNNYFNMYIDQCEQIEKKEQECFMLGSFKRKNTKLIVVIILISCFSLLLGTFSMRSLFRENRYKKLIETMRNEIVTVPVFHDALNDNLRSEYEDVMGGTIS